MVKYKSKASILVKVKNSELYLFLFYFLFIFLFTKKQGFKLKKLERPMQVRNMDGSFNKEGPIENTVEVNIYYQRHRKRTEIDVIGGQKWKVILGIPWLARHNPEIDWRTEEVKMTRCLEECGKQWRPMQGKSG